MLNNDSLWLSLIYLAYLYQGRNFTMSTEFKWSLNCVTRTISNTNKMKESAPKRQFESFENPSKSQIDTRSEISEKNSRVI